MKKSLLSIRRAARFAALPALSSLASLPNAVANAQTTYSVTTLTPTASNVTAAHGLNVKGDVTGQAAFSGNLGHAALIKSGKETELTYNPGTQSSNPPSVESFGEAINNNDQVVGWCLVGNPNFGGDAQPSALLWQPGQTVAQSLDGNFSQFFRFAKTSRRRRSTISA